MARSWTEAQQQAMNTRDKTLLVSAAAGSGKTATLTERIIRSITDPVKPADISKMLIVTFTRAAADELKNRIFAALSTEIAKNPANRYLNHQLIKLGSARICTIDSFYFDLVRSNFSALGISASLRIGDRAELDVLAKSVMENTIDEFYNNNEAFSSFAECLIGTRSANQLSDILLQLYGKISCLPEGIEFLKNYATKMNQDVASHTEFFETPIGELLKKQTKDEMEYYHSVFFSACEDLSDEPAYATMLRSLKYDRDFCATVLQQLNDSHSTYFDICTLFSDYSPIRMTMPKEEFLTEECIQYQSLRKEQIEKIRKLKNRCFSKSPSDLSRAMQDTARYTEMLYYVMQRFEQQQAEEKNKRNLLDFTDVRRLTLQLLVEKDGSPTPIARQYAEQFTDIYIDEYQDVDRVQDMIFRAISKPINRFMVGDIKQSIYGFRGAEPQVFSDYRATFPSSSSAESKASHEMTIFMSDNFRCDSCIIEFTNLICSKIFSVCTESIGYNSDDDLKCSKLLPREGYQSPKVEVAVIINASTNQDAEDSEDIADEEEDRDKIENKEVEAAYIASEIQRLLEEEKKADGSDIVAGDIAVLFRSRSMSSYLAKALAERGILSSENDGNSYFENPDVLMLLCILNTVDNPHRDIFLTGALRSPIFGFTMNDLILIRKSCDSSYSLYDALVQYKEGENELAVRCRDFDETLNNWRHQASALSVDRFLRLLFESDLFVASGLSCEQSDNGEGGNLLRLYEYARTFEAGSFKGLYNFIEFINTVIEENKKMDIPPKGASKDRVNLMTIHQSKGLEFPVCFVCGTATKFNRRDEYANLLLEYPVGIAMKLSDQTGFARINTPMRETLATMTGIKQIEEEMRVLYVAMTRARERLYITAVTSSSEEKLLNQATLRVRFCGRHVLLRCNSYLDWILLPFADPTVQTNCCRLSFLESSLSTDAIATEQHCELPDSPVADRALTEYLKQKFAFRYPYADLHRIPAKLSVSRLSPDVLDESTASADLFETESQTAIPDFFVTGQIAKASSAERGTATHLFLQFCDFEYASVHGVDSEIVRLTEKRFIPENIAALIYKDELKAFFASSFLQEIRRAKKIYREQRFNLLLSPEEFTQDSKFRSQIQNEKLAVQGVMDLIVIDREGNLCLYDYKTDRLSQQELESPELAGKRMNRTHGLQLSYYAKAASLLFGHPCKRICVYSTHAGRLFPIDPIPLSIPDETLDRL